MRLISFNTSMPLPSRKSRVYGVIQQQISDRLSKRSRAWWFKTLGKTALIVGGVGLIAGTIMVAVISRDLPDPNSVNALSAAQSTKIYDRTGTHLLYEVYQDQKRTTVPLTEISPYLPKAFIAIEDKYFYEHNGIRVTSILRATFNNVIGRKVGSGGASTLTQQFIKNAIVGDERRGFAGYFRKIKEAILALRLERKYSKEEILAMYLNQIPLGSTNYGVESAAQSYFQKSAKDLTLSESAAMAAMNQAPSRYLNNLESLRGRRDTVLTLMHNQGYITEEEMKQAQGEALRMHRNTGIFAAPHFVLHIKQQLADQFGEKVVDTGGLKVITTLDYDKQVLAEQIVKQQGEKFAKSANANNASLVAIDPKTAQVLTLVGSRDFANEEIDGQFNVAILAKRQPGSSFKPFVYLAAFEKGYTPETVLYDVKTDFDTRDGETYSPKNYDNKEHGLLTMRSSLQNSLNIPAVKAMYLVGEKNTFDFAKRFGYTTFSGNEGLSLVLGGGEVSLLEHTNAYATLADNGVYHEPVTILKVTNADGSVLSEWQPNEGIEAVKPEMAALISDVLSDDPARALVFGLNSNITLPGRPVAAKTGTTNDSKDAWTMGYVPSLATGVWVGNTIPKSMKGGGNLLAGVIWNQFMRAALKDVPVEQFPTPPVNDATKPVLTGSVGGIKLKINSLTGRIANSSTPENIIVERSYLPEHDILHYVHKDDPRGPVPINPGEDAQYQTWENALQDWVVRQNASGTVMTFAEPPTEYDTVGSPELIPTIEVLSPVSGEQVRSRDMYFSVNASAPRGVTTVIYAIDGTTVATVTQFPFSASYRAQTLTPGPHLLKVIAQDDVGNIGVKEVQFSMEAEYDAPFVTWTDGQQLAVQQDDYPRTFFLAPFRWNAIKDVKIYLQSNGTEKLIYTFTQSEVLLAGKLNFTWKNNPGVGSYELRAVTTDNQGKITEKMLPVVVQ